MDNLSSLPSVSNILDDDLFLLERDSEQKKITGQDMKAELGAAVVSGDDVMLMSFDVVNGNLLRLKYGETVVASVELQAVNAVVKPCTNLELSRYTVSQSSLDPTPITIYPIVTPSDCTQPIKWYSTKDYVAKVADGVITIQSDGNCFIQAICGNVVKKCLVVAKFPEFRFVVGSIDDDGKDVASDSGQYVRSNMLYIPKGASFVIDTENFRYDMFTYTTSGLFVSHQNAWNDDQDVTISEDCKIRFVMREKNNVSFSSNDNILNAVQSSVTIIPPDPV